MILRDKHVIHQIIDQGSLSVSHPNFPDWRAELRNDIDAKFLGTRTRLMTYRKTRPSISKNVLK